MDEPLYRMRQFWALCKVKGTVEPHYNEHFGTGRCLVIVKCLLYLNPLEIPLCGGKKCLRGEFPFFLSFFLYNCTCYYTFVAFVILRCLW